MRFWSQLSSLPLRQRFVVALVALAMLAGTVVGTLLAASGSTSPARRHPASAVASRSVRSFHDLPQGPPPTVPYWHAGVLHAAGATIRTPLRQIVSAGGTVLAGGYSDASPSRWALVDGARLQPIPHDASANFPTMSTDGNLLVWEIVRAHVTTVTAWDVHSRRLLATRRITIEQACCSGPALIVFGADSHGRVFYGDGRSLTVWTPATGAAHPVRGYGRLPALLSQVGPQGPVFEGPERTILDMTAVYGHVYRRGVFHRIGTIPSSNGLWSPDGSLIAYGADENAQISTKSPRTSVVVYDTRTGHRRRMPLPNGFGEPLAWASERSLLVESSQPARITDVARCDVVTGVCQRSMRYAHPDAWSFSHP
ncbi:MAG: hypothetical protein ACRDP1_05020 [Nocardioidaceae bacterium]